MSRFQAPFVMKISFYAPTKMNQSKNAAHLDYIGNRPGVQLEADLGDREVESLDDLPTPDSAAGHVKYAHERPGSHGLFTADGIPDIRAVQKELEQHQGIVWRMVLSLREEDAKRLNLTDRHGWENIIRSSVPDAAAKMGIGETNLKWVAAFHQERGHPHVHLVLWEKDPRRSRGQLSKGERIDVKKAFMKEIYAEERVKLYQEKTAMRDLIRDLAKDDTQKAVSLLQEVNSHIKEVETELKLNRSSKVGIAPKMYPDQMKEYASQLKELASMMPRKGRIALKFMPEDVKEKVLQIADSIIKQPAFHESYQRYMKSVEELTIQYTISPEAIEKAKLKAHEDLRNRVANVILKGGSQLNRMDRKNEFEPKFIKNQSLSIANNVWKSVWRAIEKESMRSEAEREMLKKQMERQRQRQKQNEREN